MTWLEVRVFADWVGSHLHFIDYTGVWVQDVDSVIESSFHLRLGRSKDLAVLFVAMSHHLAAYAIGPSHSWCSSTRPA